MTIPTTPEAIDRAVAAQDEAWREPNFRNAGYITPDSLRALLEAQPREWDAETINGAPEGEYMILSNKGWTGRWEQVILGQLNHVRDFFDDGGHAWKNYRPFGPIPHHPTGNEKGEG